MCRVLQRAACTTERHQLTCTLSCARLLGLALLLELGAMTSLRDNRGRTALMWAAQAGQADVVCFLLDWHSESILLTPRTLEFTSESFEPSPCPQRDLSCFFRPLATGCLCACCSPATRLRFFGCLGGGTLRRGGARNALYALAAASAASESMSSGSSSTSSAST